MKNIITILCLSFAMVCILIGNILGFILFTILALMFYQPQED